MSILLAKTKGRNSDFFKVLSSPENIFNSPDTSETQEYSSGYKLEDGEWYRIDQFLDLDLNREYQNGLIETEFNSINYNQITEENYSNISYFCCRQGDHFLFQKFFPKQFISKKWFSISDEPSIRVDRPIIVLHDFMDAVYDKANDVLYFKEITKIKSMFNGIEELYREATQAEVDTFLGYNFVTLDVGFASNDVKTANRKRIATAIDTFANFSENAKRQIFEYTKLYCRDVPSTNTHFTISTEEHLKLILFGIEQRYYTTPIGDEKRLANSVLKIEGN